MTTSCGGQKIPKFFPAVVLASRKEQGGEQAGMSIRRSLRELQLSIASAGGYDRKQACSSVSARKYQSLGSQIPGIDHFSMVQVHVLGHSFLVVRGRLRRSSNARILGWPFKLLSTALASTHGSSVV